MTNKESFRFTLPTRIGWGLAILWISLLGVVPFADAAVASRFGLVFGAMITACFLVAVLQRRRDRWSVAGLLLGILMTLTAVLVLVKPAIR